MQKLKEFFSPQHVITGLIYAVAFLLPIFFIPSMGISLGISKSILVSSGFLLATLVFLIYTLVSGKIALPRGFVAYGVLGIIGATLLSGLLSPVTRVSFFGGGFQLDSVLFIVTLFLGLFIITTALRSYRKFFFIYVLLFTSFFFLGVVHVIRLIGGPDTLSLGILASPVATLVGGWYDLGIVAGALLIVSMVTIQFFPGGKGIKVIIGILGAGAVVLLALVNFPPLWILIGLFALLVLLYTVSFSDWDSKKRSFTKGRALPIYPLVILLVSLWFIFAGGPTSQFITKYTNTAYSEIRPSVSATFKVIGKSLRRNPVTGIGPARFDRGWEQWKPTDLSGTQLESISFSFGTSFIVTTFATTGTFGFLAWLLFIGAFLVYGFRTVFKPFKSTLARYFTLSSFMAAAFLWILTFLYTPNIVSIVLAIIFTGIALGSGILEGHVKEVKISFLRNPRASFLGILVLLALIALVFIMLITPIKHYGAFKQYQKGLQTIGTDFETGEALLRRSVQITSHDQYLRTLSRVRLEQIVLILNENPPSSQELSQTIEQLITESLGYAEAAIDFDDTHFANWVTRGNTYAVMAELGIEGASDMLYESYAMALELNPTNTTLNTIVTTLETQPNANVVEQGTQLVEDIEEQEVQETLVGEHATTTDEG